MNVQQIFDLAIRLGVQNDLRGVKRVQQNLRRLKDKFEQLAKDKQRDFDLNKLTNPYADTQILVDNKKSVRKILAGIDVDTAELLLAKELGDIDLVIAHHPLGKGLANLAEVLPMQVEILASYGVPLNVAQGCLRLRIDEVSRGVGPANHYKTVDAAELLGLNLMCCHTVCDNLVAMFLKKQISKKQFEYVGEVLEFIKQIPEYAAAQKRGAGPRLFAGAEDNYCGKISLTEITGGTEGSSKIYRELATAGIGTIIGMHMSEEHKKQAEENHINAVIAGHISSDSLGVNLLLDELERRKIAVATCSGLIRVRR